MYPRAQWRLLLSAAADGPTNMAVDEAILFAVTAGESLPTLRLFAWQPPCLSLGRAQSESDVDWERLRARGWGWVRRPTGGRAILHTDELTYSVAAPPTEPRLAGSILESYRRLSAGLMAGLRRLGLRVYSDAEPVSADDAGPVCFEAPSNYEITAGGKKLVGSAQLRRAGSVLQHGALPLCGDIARICEALIFSDEVERRAAAERVRARATTVAEVAGRLVDWAEAAQALSDGFAEALNLDWQPGSLTPAEQTRAEGLRATKYHCTAVAITNTTSVNPSDSIRLSR